MLLLLFFFTLVGGQIVDIVCFIRNRTLKGGATGGYFSGLGELHVSMDLIRVFQ